MSTVSLVWFRQDLRIDDNPALASAIGKGNPIIPIFVWPDDRGIEWNLGESSSWWLRQSLNSLDCELRTKGSRLIIKKGSTMDVLLQLANQTQVSNLFYNRRFEPSEIKLEMAVNRSFIKKGISVYYFNANLLFEPEHLLKNDLTPYRVFSHFFKKATSIIWDVAPLATGQSWKSPSGWPRSDFIPPDNRRLDNSELVDTWTPGTTYAKTLFTDFLLTKANKYYEHRNRIDQDVTSRLSPHLHFGEISVKSIVRLCLTSNYYSNQNDDDFIDSSFFKQLIWREFAYNVLINNPETPSNSLRNNSGHVIRSKDRRGLVEWQTGQTGYPIIDAAMRQLQAQGWVNNRLRMIVASFLNKHLLIPWQDGAIHFWNKLVDADLANNTLGWQWIAGCGTDPMPFFRIFNPVRQGQLFDPEGGYVKSWVPELYNLNHRWIHRPWETPRDVLLKQGIQLGVSYPYPIVDHQYARSRASQALKPS
jgi:deoxyribodipyrimidine photo-lyase